MVITDASTKLTEIEIKKVGSHSETHVQEAADVEAVRLSKRKVVKHADLAFAPPTNDHN